MMALPSRSWTTAALPQLSRIDWCIAWAFCSSCFLRVADMAGELRRIEESKKSEVDVLRCRRFVKSEQRHAKLRPTKSPSPSFIVYPVVYTTISIELYRLEVVTTKFEFTFRTKLRDIAVASAATKLRSLATISSGDAAPSPKNLKWLARWSCNTCNSYRRSSRRAKSGCCRQSSCVRGW